ncbi:hypothetical protein J2S00_001393 [Caldalkalibacillus uzonensis]|uniref:Glucuronate isomerase n=1 Tax=Caldalkalibacillus uzonensis TaxID=353224 RepID=A0ABU0CR47_9BACI|nr:glucuronate isomerase [Caldalkalibacillus uzonensis]MDQ0338607.1 hypothetical protein [Caldalkalibacillus uzonensis]
MQTEQPITQPNEIEKIVDHALNQTKIIDMHTHLFPPSFESLCLTGIDQLLNYHYLVSETFLWSDLPYETFWRLSEKERAEYVWETLFVHNSPVSEAGQGLLTILQMLDVPVSKDLNQIRRWFNQQRDVHKYIDRIMDMANIDRIVMTNDPFDPVERKLWKKQHPDQRFLPALRLDPLLNHWSDTYPLLQSMGYDVMEKLTTQTVEQVQRFIRDWIAVMNPVYVAVSLPYYFNYPQDSVSTALLDHCLLPVCAEYRLPLALMIGTKRRVNPDLQLAGDMAGHAELTSLEHLCRNYPQQKFLVTMLSRENQYELVTLAQKFRNMMVFGCWWFLNTPQLIEEISQMRFDQLGNRFIFQHSDCRIFEQLLYKWAHSKQVLRGMLVKNYQALLERGWQQTAADIRRDIDKLLCRNFVDFVQLPSS